MFELDLALSRHLDIHQVLTLKALAWLRGQVPRTLHCNKQCAGFKSIFVFIHSATPKLYEIDYSLYFKC